MASQAGSIDASFNLIARGDVQGIPLVDMTTADLSAEVGPHGVRVIGLYTAGVPETLTREKLAAVGGEGVPDPETVERMLAGMTMLRRAPRLAPVADAAAFLASDRAAAMTGRMVNVTCGLVPG